jgi:hypothetical protein
MSGSISRPRPGRPRGRVLSALLVALLLNSAYAAGAPQAGTITVKVKDPAGNAVANATVMVENVETLQSIERTTDGAGVALFVGLAQGRYNVTVEALGFKKLRWEGVEVSPNKRAAAIDVDLTIGPANQLELLTAKGERVEEARESRGEGLSALPNLNYDLTPVLQNIPGAVATGPSSLGRVIVDGKGADQQTLRLDGVDFTSQVEFPSADSAVSAVGSFQKPEVAGNLDRPKTRSGAFGYPATAGPGSGLVTEIDTYKGTDRTSVQFYGDLRHDALNARNFFDYDGENGLRRARFGGKFGTTLDARNRTGLFLAYDGWRGRVERNIYEAIPAVAASGTPVGPLGLLMRGFLPAGTEAVPGSLNSDFVVARRRARTTAESNAFDARLDYRPLYPGPTATSADKDSPAARAVLTFRLTHQMAENRVPEGVAGRSQLQQFAFTNAVVGFRMVNGLKAVRNENLLKQSQKELGHFFRFGINRTHARVKAEAPSTGGFDLSQALVNISSLPIKTQGLPIAPPPDGQQLTIPVASLGGLLGGVGRGLDLKPTSYSAVYDYATLITGDSLHELYAGGEARFIRLGYDRLGGLTYSFPSVAALGSGTPSSVTFLSDLSAQGPFRPGTGYRQARQEFYMGYFQMVSQFRRKAHQQSHDQNPNADQLEPALTLTYGVRYDHFGGARERDDRAVVVNPLTGEILPAGSPFYRVEHDNIQPRFGLAYRLSDGGPFKGTVLRAGIGLYSGVPRIGDLLLPIDSDRYSVRINTGATLPSSPADLMRVFDLNTQARFYQPLAFARDYSPLERSLKWDVRLGHTHNGYEYSAYYIGNVGRNLALANFANRITGVRTNPDPTKPAIVTREFGDAFDEFQYRRGGGRSSFNALTLQLSRDADDTSDTPKRWLKIPVSSFTAKYTLSRGVGNVSGTLMSNPLDPDADFGDNAGVARHSFLLNATYDLWQLSKDRRLNHVLLGWKLMPVLKMTSGLPLVVRLQRPDVVYVDGSGNIFGSAAAGRTAVLNTPGGGGAAGAYVPSLIPGVNPYAGGFAGRLYLDPAAFSIPAPGTLGNVRRGQFKGPAVVQLDLGLRRHFFNSEKKQLEFQVEIFNVFNRANFFSPAASLPNALGTSTADNQIQPGVPFGRAGAGAFGFITAADQGRLIQFSLTLKLNKGFTK